MSRSPNVVENGSQDAAASHMQADGRPPLQRTLLSGAVAIALALVLSRLLGLLRDLIIADRFGATATADVVILVVELPDLLASALGLGGAATALIVAYGARPEHARLLYAQAGLALGAMFLLVAALLSVMAPWLISVMAPGFGDAAASQATDAARIALWALPAIALVWPAVAYAHWRNSFFFPALGGAIVNAAVIAALIAAATQTAPTWVAIAAVIGALARWGVAAGPTLMDARPWRVFAGPWRVDLGLLRGMAAAAGAELSQIVYLVALRSFATLYGAGVLTTLAFALKIGLLPLYVVVAALVQVAFAKVVRAIGKSPEAVSATGAGPMMGLVLLAGLLIAPTIAVFSNDAAMALFGWFSLKEGALDRVGLLLAAFSASFLALSLNMMLRRLLGVVDGFGVALRAELSGLVVFGLLAAFLLSQEAGLWALVLASALGQFVATVGMLLALRSRGIDLISPMISAERFYDFAVLSITLGGALACAASLRFGEGPVAAIGHLALGAVAVALATVVCLAIRKEMRGTLRSAFAER